MKVSKYNLIITKGDRKFAYNQLRSSLLEIDDSLSLLLGMPNAKFESRDEELSKELLKVGMLCEDELVEENLVLASSKNLRFANDTARVTILPTLNCNFHCWYCYEDHHDNKMNLKDIDKVVLFCKNLINKGSIKNFHLDWFGGEPLLYFNDIVYPISMIIREHCQSCGVNFQNSITTNGYLISQVMIEKMKEIQLTSFQITLDGGKKFHNKTRFSSSERNSFDTIVGNITNLCRSIAGIHMLVRINYTPKNLDSIEEIAEVFPADVRPIIRVVPQLVWQFKASMNMIGDSLKEKMMTFIKSGYKNAFSDLGCSLCYAENMNQFVINYNLSVYKCTARDFSEKYSIGNINEKGDFIPKPYFYEYFKASYFETKSCMDCHLLPSCLGICIQRHLEHNIHKCNKNELEKSIRNKVLLYINQKNEHRE